MQNLARFRTEVFKIRQVFDLLRFLLHSVKKVWWTLVH